MSAYQNMSLGGLALDENSTSPMLSLRDVQCRFDNHNAVSDVSLDIKAGEVVCLLGPSGCGKTTLLRIAAGLQAPTHGSVLLGKDLVSEPGNIHWPPERRNVGLAFQESALFPHLTVLDNVCFGLGTLPVRERKSRALYLLRRLGMADYARAFPHTLSGGQQQRVALARALAPSPRVMLLDEPFSSLDARLRDQIRDDTLHVLKEMGTATLLVTHDPEEAMFMADRIALMRDGQVVQAGTPTDLYCRPADPFVVRFFGQVNEYDSQAKGGKVATPLGRLDAGTIPDGSAVKVMIRPEAVQVSPLNQGESRAHASHVLMSRLLGATSLLHICAHSPDRQEMHLHARVPGVFLPPEGQQIDLDLDMSQVFMFRQ